METFTPCAIWYFAPPGILQKGLLMRILIIKLAAIGDVVMALSAVKVAKDLYPGCEITWMVGASIQPLLQQIDAIDHIITVDERALLTGRRKDQLRELLACWKRLAGQCFDLIVIGHRDRRYRLLALTAKGATRRAFGDIAGRPWPVPGRHHADEYARLITGIDGPAATAGRLPALRMVALPPKVEAELASAGQRQLILIAAGGAKNALRDDALRRWPVQRYAQLAARLIDSGFSVGLIGAPSDAWIRPAFGGLAIIDFLGLTNLAELPSLLGRAALVISHDTSAIHLARLVGTPVIALFGPTVPSEKVYPDPRSFVLWGGEGMACRPCYDGRDFASCQQPLCMETITVDQVLTAAHRAIA